MGFTVFTLVIHPGGGGLRVDGRVARRRECTVSVVLRVPVDGGTVTRTVKMSGDAICERVGHGYSTQDNDCDVRLTRQGTSEHGRRGRHGRILAPTVEGQVVGLLGGKFDPRRVINEDHLRKVTVMSRRAVCH